MVTGKLNCLREKAKNNKYRWQSDLINFLFLSACTEDDGAMGNSLKGLIKHIVRNGGASDED